MSSLSLEFTPNLVHGLAFGTTKFYIAPYGKIKHGLGNLSYNCDVKSALKVISTKADTANQTNVKLYILVPTFHRSHTYDAGHDAESTRILAGKFLYVGQTFT